MLSIDSQNSPANESPSLNWEESQEQGILTPFPVRKPLASPRINKLLRRRKGDDVASSTVRPKIRVEQNLSSSFRNKKIKTRKSVDFSKQLEQHTHSSPYQLSKAERSKIWLSSKELREISEEMKTIRRTLRLGLNNNEQQKGDTSCLRGMEDTISIRANQECQTRIACVVQAVLDEQRRQDDNCIFDPTLLREQSRQVSKDSKMIALERADKDAKEVREKKPVAKCLREYYSPRKNSSKRLLNATSPRPSARKLSDLSTPDAWQ